MFPTIPRLESPSSRQSLPGRWRPVILVVSFPPAAPGWMLLRDWGLLGLGSETDEVLPELLDSSLFFRFTRLAAFFRNLRRMVGSGSYKPVWPNTTFTSFWLSAFTSRFFFFLFRLFFFSAFLFSSEETEGAFFSRSSFHGRLEGLLNILWSARSSASSQPVATGFFGK